jgi:hypothetical protein
VVYKIDRFLLNNIKLPPIKRRVRREDQLIDIKPRDRDVNQSNDAHEKSFTDSIKLPMLGKPETYIFELKEKVRELEINLIDARSDFERKLNSLLEEVPNRLTRELKTIEDRDNFQWKDTK